MSLRSVVNLRAINGRAKTTDWAAKDPHVIDANYEVLDQVSCVLGLLARLLI